MRQTLLVDHKPRVSARQRAVVPRRDKQARRALCAVDRSQPVGPHLQDDVFAVRQTLDQHGGEAAARRDAVQEGHA